MTFVWLKGHGTENDFLLLPDPDGTVHGELAPTVVAALCERRRGIGADGVLRVVRSAALGEPSAAEWFMDYRNADGSLSEMCGNGIRVFALHLLAEGLVSPGEPLLIGTRAGDRGVTIESADRISVEMGPAKVGGVSTVTAAGRSWDAHEVHTGNPHAVVMVDDLADAGSLRDEPEYDRSVYPDGVNIEFVRALGPGHLRIRVHERGSGETRSCGTGACAAAAVQALTGSTVGEYSTAGVRVDLPGGTVEVRVRPDGLTMTGPARIVARGEMELMT